MENSICEICHEEFENEYKMEIHNIRQHKNKANKCKICNKSFNSIVYHLKKQHPEEYKNTDTKELVEINPDLYCKFCNTGFTMAHYLYGHITSIHEKEIVVCDICNKSMKVAALYDHKRNFHKEPEEYYQYKCETCKQKFKHKHTYERHLKKDSHKILEKKTDIDYSEIDKKVEEIKKEKRGIKETNKSFKCGSCEKSFITKASLYTHEKFVHSSKIFECKFCDKTFKTKHSCNRHNNSVHSEPKFECKICKQKFNRKDKLKRHIESVHNKETIECETCKTKMTKRNYYENHIKLCLINSVLHNYPGTSKWERMVSKYLMDNDINFESQCSFEDLKRVKCLAYDFYIEEKSILIEINGKQHYEPTNFRDAETRLLGVQESDKLKKNYADNNDIKLIVIDTREYNTFDKIESFLENRF